MYALFSPTSPIKGGAVCQVPRWFHEVEDPIFKVGDFEEDFYQGDLQKRQGDTVYDNDAKSGILLYQAWYVPVMRIDVKEYLPDGINITAFNKALALHVSEVGDRFFKRFKNMRPEDMNDAFFGELLNHLSSSLQHLVLVCSTLLCVALPCALPCPLPSALPCPALPCFVHNFVQRDTARTPDSSRPHPPPPPPREEWQQEGGFNAHFLGDGKKAWAMNMLKDILAHLLVKVGMHLGLDADVIGGFQQFERDRIKVRQGKKRPGTIEPELVSLGRRRGWCVCLPSPEIRWRMFLPSHAVRFDVI